MESDGRTRVHKDLDHNRNPQGFGRTLLAPWVVNVRLPGYADPLGVGICVGLNALEDQGVVGVRPIPRPWADPKSRTTLGFHNLHHRSARVQIWGIYFLDAPGALGFKATD